MSINRQEPVLRALGLSLPAGHRLSTHTHDWPQLIFASRGVISVSTEEGLWVVPPMRALWLGADVPHALEFRGAVELRTLYFNLDHPQTEDSAQHFSLSSFSGTSCCVITVSPLLRELIISMVATGAVFDRTPSDRARLQLLHDLLAVNPERPLSLPIPADERARRVAARAMKRIASDDAINNLAAGSGASARTIERVFLTETGMTFGRWRQQARLLEAIRQLGEGPPYPAVTSVANRVGYRSPSAFVAAFRANFGISPGQYFAASHGRNLREGN